MSHSKVFIAKFSGTICSRCGKDIAKGQRIIVTTKRGKLVGKHSHVKDQKRWAHAKCVFKKEDQ